MTGPTHPQTNPDYQHSVRTITSQVPKEPSPPAVGVGERPVPQISPILATLEIVFSPAASPRDRRLASVIRCLGRYLVARPIEMSDEELEILQAVGIVLARHRPKRSTP